MTDAYIRLNGRPFTISRSTQYRNTECPFYTAKANRKTAGIAVEFCVHETNFGEFIKTSSRLISCTDCKL